MMQEDAPSYLAPPIRSRVIGSNVWLLSFGDLVTLLLGFFVAIIAYAMQQPAPSAVPPVAIGRQDGIALAEDSAVREGAPSRYLLSMPARAFDPGTGALQEEGANLLKMFMRFDPSTVQGVLIQSCFEDGTGRTELGQFAGTSRSLAIASQLLDAGVAAAVLQVGLPTAGCADGVSPDGAEVAITIRRFQ